MRQDVVILGFWMLSFKPAFSLSYFSFFKRLFSSFSLSASRVLSSVYLKLFIFLLVILIPACGSSSPAFHMVYPAYKLDNQSDNIQSWCSVFPILIQSIVPCPVLSVASWPAYRFLRRQVRWSRNPSYFYIPCLTEIHLVKWQDLYIFNNNWHIFENPSKYENNDNSAVWSWSQRRYKKKKKKRSPEFHPWNVRGEMFKVASYLFVPLGLPSWIR